MCFLALDGFWRTNVTQMDPGSSHEKEAGPCREARWGWRGQQGPGHGEPTSTVSVWRWGALMKGEDEEQFDQICTLQSIGRMRSWNLRRSPCPNSNSRLQRQPPRLWSPLFFPLLSNMRTLEVITCKEPTQACFARKAVNWFVEQGGTRDGKFQAQLDLENPRLWGLFLLFSLALWWDLSPQWYRNSNKYRPLFWYQALL